MRDHMCIINIHDYLATSLPHHHAVHDFIMRVLVWFLSVTFWVVNNYTRKQKNVILGQKVNCKQYY